MIEKLYYVSYVQPYAFYQTDKIIFTLLDGFENNFIREQATKACGSFGSMEERVYIDIVRRYLSINYMVIGIDNNHNLFTCTISRKEYDYLCVENVKYHGDIKITDFHKTYNIFLRTNKLKQLIK